MLGAFAGSLNRLGEGFRMNHKEREQIAIESYERERGKYEAKVLLFQAEMEQTQSDIDDFDRVVEGTLKNVEQARRNDRYGANVKSAIDRMTEWQDICRYYGFGAVANNAIGSHFGNVNQSGDAGSAYGIGAGTVGIGAGIGAAAGAYGLAGAIGVASTGTAIGTLSGAAATSASLAGWRRIGRRRSRHDWRRSGSYGHRIDSVGRCRHCCRGSVQAAKSETSRRD